MIVGFSFSFSNRFMKNIYEPLLLYIQVVLFTMHEKDTVNEA